jgi:hypothetical protein
MVGALFVTVLGTGIIALTIKAAWLRPLVYHYPHPSAAAAYGHVLPPASTPTATQPCAWSSRSSG